MDSNVPSCTCICIRGLMQSMLHDATGESDVVCYFLIRDHGGLCAADGVCDCTAVVILMCFLVLTAGSS